MLFHMPLIYASEWSIQVVSASDRVVFSFLLRLESIDRYQLQQDSFYNLIEAKNMHT